MSPADRGLQIPERKDAPVVEDPAIVAGKKAEAAHAAWLAVPHSTVDDEATQEFQDAEQAWLKAGRDFADAPVTSIAGMFVKVRALVDDLIEDAPAGEADPSWEYRHAKTILPFLEGLAGAPSVVEDDVIEPDTGICLVDVAAKDIARELADNSWADRAQFFNNALVESLDTMGEAVEALEKKKEKPDTKEFLDICLIAMHGRIGEVLDIWGLEVPPDEDAARVFALSGSPEHRDAARVFCGTSQDAVDRLFKPANGLTVFKRMSELSRPGLNELWREHIRDKKREGAAS